MDPSLVDSGYNESLSLQCLESVFDLKGKKDNDQIDSPASPSAPCLHHCLDHQGFEEYLDDIYYHRLSIEYKYLVTSCLENQPEVYTFFSFMTDHRDSVNGHIFFNYFTCFSYLLSVFIKSLSVAPRFSVYGCG